MQQNELPGYQKVMCVVKSGQGSDPTDSNDFGRLNGLSLAGGILLIIDAGSVLSCNSGQLT